MDYPGCFHPEHGKPDQIVSRVFLKALHIILHSRIPSLPMNDRHGDNISGSQVRKSDKWFNLVLGDRTAALDKLHFWHRNLKDPMIIDIILVHPKPASSSSSAYPLTDISDSGPSVETVIERWVVQYDSTMVTSPPIADNSTSDKKTYKKSIILLRSLYLQMRLLPAYRISKQLSSSSHRSRNIDLVYKVSSFCDPFAGSEKMMKDYSFPPIQTLNGRLRLSVTYRSSLSDLKLEPFQNLQPKIITDYVGSPNTDPMRYFPASEKGCRITLGRKAPCPCPSERPRSWTSGFHKPAYTARTQSLGRINYPGNGLYAPEDMDSSPPVSFSASPSRPTHLSGGNQMQAHTAPVTIPPSAACRSSRYPSSNLSDPNKSLLPPLSPRSTKYHSSSQDSTPGIRSYKSTEGFRPGDSPSGLSNRYSCHKVVRDSKDDSGRFPVMLSSSSSPRFTYSRSSTVDDLDDCDFSCPFALDDIGPAEFGGSQNADWRKNWNSTSHPNSVSQTSQDAAVGVLVQMLRTAPPLRQDQSCYSSPPLNSVNNGSESGLSLSRRTSDALEELNSYKAMRDLLISKSAIGIVDKDAS